MFEYKCKLVKVVDGDTVDVDIDLGFGVWLQKQRIRLYGIDTPESRTSDDVEKIYGLAAKERMQKWLDGGSLKIVTHKDAKGKYGRILGELYTFETNINNKMVEEHHAVGYHRQAKEEIAEEHILNRKYVDEQLRTVQSFEE